MKKLMSLFLSILIIIGSFSCLSFTTASAITTSQYNIAARADYMWNTVWTCQKDFTGWNNTTFVRSKVYHLPYGKPIDAGQFIGYDVTLESFFEATKYASSAFYSAKSLGNGISSTYYATDCGGFVSWCWGVDRQTVETIPNISTYIDSVTLENLSKLQVGDALNSTTAGHVTLVTGLTFVDGEIATIQITEQTPPQLSRMYYTPEEIMTKYGNSYSIYRYTGEVPQSPVVDLQSGEVTQPTKPTTVYYPACDSSIPTFAEALSAIGVDTNYTQRKKIANANGITDYSGTYEQNMQLFSLFKSGLLINPDVSSESTITTYDFPAANPPFGAVETVTTGASAVTLNGWAYDANDTEAQLDIHVYIGGDSTSADAEHHIFNANRLREDISDSFEIDNYHGFSQTIETERTGEQDIHIYASNVGLGYDTHIGYAHVNIPIETTAPVISDVKVSDVINNSYTITCQVSDNSGTVESVKFPTFKSTQTIDDAVWYEGTFENGVATVTIPVDSTATYITHIYAYDPYGNYSVYEISKDFILDIENPQISNAKITNVSKSGYTISCNVSDNVGITSVKFPSFHSSKTIEEAVWYEATVKDGVASATISVADLGAFGGTYYTHIYAYDQAGNFATKILFADVDKDSTGPVISNIKAFDITSKGFTVTCNITDESEISEIRFHSYKISETISSSKLNDYTFENGVATSQISVDSAGTYYVRIYAYDIYKNLTTVSYVVNTTVGTEKPVISDIKITDITDRSYTISCDVSGSIEIDKVDFLAFHSSNAVMNSVLYQGTLDDGIAYVTIPLADLGNLTGIYYTRIYAYDVNGKAYVQEVSVEISTVATSPLISNVEVTNVTNKSYTVSCKITDDDQITNVKFPSFHSSKTIEDAVWYEGTVKDGVATATISIDELGNLNGTYYTHIYAYDSNGNSSVEEVSVEINTDISGPVISEITVTNATKSSYTVSCKVSDDTEVTSVKFLSLHSSLSPEQGVWYEGKIENGIVTITIPVEEFGTLSGLFETHIYAYDAYNNQTVEKASVEINTNLADVNCDGIVDIKDVTAIQEHLAGIETIDDAGIENADVNGDGKLSIRDATVIQLYLAHIIVL